MRRICQEKIEIQTNAFVLIFWLKGKILCKPAPISPFHGFLFEILFYLQ